MRIYKTVRGLRNRISILRKQGHTVGFSPTMGALHEGHLSLVEQSQNENDISVVSIFVNPTQFNNQKDLSKYPRVLEEDVSLLKSQKLDILFCPNEKQIYPNGKDYKLDVDLAGLDNQMEGAFRPGHFEGVVQVVKRLLDIVEPDKLYMGQKDFQQFTIIDQMIKFYGLDTELRVVPIKREQSGLAMSSRNRRLSKANRDKAAIIHQILSEAKNKYNSNSPEKLSKWAIRKLKGHDFDPEYFIFADGTTLKNINTFKSHKYVVACVAAWIQGVRLIDNMIIKIPK